MGFLFGSAMRVERLTCSAPARIGGELTIELTLEPSKPVRVANYRAMARVIVFERLVLHGGEDSETVEHVLHELKLPISVPADLRAPFVQTWSVRLPRDMPPSFESMDLALRTQAEVKLSYDSFGSVSLKTPITVLPEYARE